MKKYWYKFFVSSCPVCGSGETLKERQYSPKPKDERERYEYYDSFDNCIYV